MKVRGYRIEYEYKYPNLAEGGLHWVHWQKPFELLDGGIDLGPMSCINRAIAAVDTSGLRPRYSQHAVQQFALQRQPQHRSEKVTFRMPSPHYLECNSSLSSLDMRT